MHGHIGAVQLHSFLLLFTLLQRCTQYCPQCMDILVQSSFIHFCYYLPRCSVAPSIAHNAWTYWCSPALFIFVIIYLVAALHLVLPTMHGHIGAVQLHSFLLLFTLLQRCTQYCPQCMDILVQSSFIHFCYYLPCCSVAPSIAHNAWTYWCSPALFIFVIIYFAAALHPVLPTMHGHIGAVQLYSFLLLFTLLQRCTQYCPQCMDILVQSSFIHFCYYLPCCSVAPSIAHSAWTYWCSPGAESGFALSLALVMC